MSYPDFICIGAQKGATTWLHSNLRKHTDVWLPKRDELHYFDSIFPIDILANEYSLAAKSKIRGKKHVLRKKRIRSIIKKYDWPTFKWELKYRLGCRNDLWYERLFDCPADMITGDLTPNYALLSEDAIRYVHKLIPNVKIIYLIRDPIERAWSHAKMDLAIHAGRALSEIDNSEFLQHFNLQSAIERGDYVKTYKKWVSIFGVNNVNIIFQDDIANDPKNVFSHVCSLIDINKKICPDGLDKKIHAGSEMLIPPRLRGELIKIYLPLLRAQADVFEGHAITWLEKYK